MVKFAVEFWWKMLLKIFPAKEARKSPPKLRRKFATNFAENFANFTLEIAGAYIFPLFYAFFPLFLRISLLLLKDKGKQQQFTAKMGNFTPTPSAPTPCKTFQIDRRRSKPSGSFRDISKRFPKDPTILKTLRIANHYSTPSKWAMAQIIYLNSCQSRFSGAHLVL